MSLSKIREFKDHIPYIFSLFITYLTSSP